MQSQRTPSCRRTPNRRVGPAALSAGPPFREGACPGGPAVQSDLVPPYVDSVLTKVSTDFRDCESEGVLVRWRSRASGRGVPKLVLGNKSSTSALDYAMDQKIPVQEDYEVFNTFSYLLNTAVHLAEISRVHEEGSNLSRVSSVVFCAFAFEALLNHIGSYRVQFWSVIEKKLSWQDKLSIIGSEINRKLDNGTEPGQSIHKAFKFRDRMAHGKTENLDPDPTELSRFSTPDWLKEWCNQGAVDKLVETVKQLTNDYLTAAGCPSTDWRVQGMGKFTLSQHDES